MLERRTNDIFAHTLWFIRHGATQPNLDGLRCGGDLDVPLTAIGREQILSAAQALATRDMHLDLIVTSPLQRTRESASILGRVLGGLPIVLHGGFKERMLGRWNLQPMNDTEESLRSGVTPPGGESAVAFHARIQWALSTMLQEHPRRRILLVGSRGVGRVLRETLGDGVTGAATRNAEWLAFDLARAPIAQAEDARMAS